MPLKDWFYQLKPLCIIHKRLLRNGLLGYAWHMTMRILLIQLADIGDLILATPALAALREAHPQAHLTLLCFRHSAAVLEAGLVDEVLIFERREFSVRGLLRPATLRRIWALRQGQYDVVLFLHHFTLWLGTPKFALLAYASHAPRRLGLQNGKAWFLNESILDEGFGAQHQAVYWLNLVSLLGAEAKPRRARVARHDGILPIATTTQRRIIIHGGSGGYSLARRWSIEGFAQVADALISEYDAQIVLVGTTADDAQAIQRAMKYPAVNLTGKTSLPQLADVLRSADLFIGADSGVMHLAAAVSTPTIALFGASNAQAWGAWSPQGNARILRSGVRCSPCAYVGHEIGAREGCHARTCMKLITPAQVLAQARQFLQEDTEDALGATNPLLALQQAAQAAPEQNTTSHASASQERVRILGFAHPRLSYEAWMSHILDIVGRGGFRQIVLSDYAGLLRARRDAVWRAILSRADALVPCGVALAWAANWLNKLLPEQIDRYGIVALLLEAAEQNGWRVFLLGDLPESAERAASAIHEFLPRLSIVGMMQGIETPEAEDALCAQIRLTGADILLVGWSSPRADHWIARNSPRLGVALALGVGDVLRDLAQLQVQAPDWAQRWRITGLYLFLRQPQRWRALWQVPQFVTRVLWQRLRGER